MIKLSEVYGISRGIPKYTYVDRSGLDARFSYLLDTERHIVIHGASKQGKSCLRRKNLDESNCVIIQCKPIMNNKEIWNNALRQLEATFSSSINVTKKSSSSVGGKIDAEGNILVAKVAGEVHSEISSGHENQYEKNFLAGKENDLDYLATELKQKNKRLIIEDFHYLTEEERRNVAFDLKALYELGVYVIVVGIWSEQNLLTYYNGDLTGRIEEININWNTVELSNVIEKGEEILNVKFNEDLKHEIIESSFQNVGILQRLAEKICLANNVLTPLLTSFNFEKNGNFDDAVKRQLKQELGVIVKPIKVLGTYEILTQDSGQKKIQA